MGEIEGVEHGAAVRVVERRAFAANVGRPHRHPARIDRPGVTRSDNAIHPAEEQSAGIAGAADLALAGLGVRNSPQPGHLAGLGDGGPHDQGGATHHQHVAVAVGAGHHLLAQRVDGADRQHGAGPVHLPGGGADRLHPGHLLDGRASLGAGRRIPAGPVEQGVRGGGGGEVDHRLARQGVVGHRRRRPVSGRIGGFGGRPAQELGGLAQRREAAEPFFPAPGARPRSSPYSSPGVHGPARGIDGGQRGHHRRNGHRAHLGPGSQLIQGRQRTAPPRLVGIVLQPVGGRHPQLMGDPHPRRHVAVLVGGYRFDRGGADVDADCDVVT